MKFANLRSGSRLNRQRGLSLPVIIIIASVVVLGGAGGWYYFTNRTLADSDPKEVLNPQYLVLKDLVVNLLDEEEAHYMQVEVTLMTRSPKCFTKLEMYKPVIKSELLDVFAKQQFSAMGKPNTREALAEQAMQALQALPSKYRMQKLENVLITGLVVQ